MQIVSIPSPAPAPASPAMPCDSSPDESWGPAHENFRVCDILNAMNSFDDRDRTNIVSGKIHSLEYVRLQFELLPVDASDRRGYEPWKVAELRAYLKNGMIYDSTVTNLLGVTANFDHLQFETAPGDEATYRIEAGNSTDGPVGYVAYVEATSKAEAEKKLREISTAENCDAATIRFEGIEVCVYINPRWISAELYQ